MYICSLYPQSGIATSCTASNRGELYHDKRTAKVYQCDGQRWRDWVVFSFNDPNANQQSSDCEQGTVNKKWYLFEQRWWVIVIPSGHVY